MAGYAPFPASAETRFVEAGGVRMRVVIDGAGPDIVFIPGGDSPAEAYAPMIAHLRGRFRCVAYDPRGAGETTAPPPPWSIADFAADCAAVIRACADGPVVLTGLSMGGLITQQTAIDFPDLLSRAVPMGAAAYIDGFTRDWMQAEIDIREEGVRLPDYFLPVHYAAYALPAKALGDPALWPEIKAAYSARFAARDPQDLIAQWRACLDFDCRDALAGCPIPFDVVAFSEDVQTPPAMGAVIAERARRGRLHEMPGLGHVSLGRHRPDLVAEKLAEIVAADPP